MPGSGCDVRQGLSLQPSGESSSAPGRQFFFFKQLTGRAPGVGCLGGSKVGAGKGAPETHERRGGGSLRRHRAPRPGRVELSLPSPHRHVLQEVCLLDRFLFDITDSPLSDELASEYSERDGAPPIFRGSFLGSYFTIIPGIAPIIDDADLVMLGTRRQRARHPCPG